MELHQYLNGELPEISNAPPQALADALITSPTSPRSERRRSLPTSMSMISLVNVTSPKPEVTEFQLRRRKAAKLTQFFGVDYVDLIKDVLESIEKGVDEERKGGVLQPGEAEVSSYTCRSIF
jgi:hypothetical protein